MKLPIIASILLLSSSVLVLSQSTECKAGWDKVEHPPQSGRFRCSKIDCARRCPLGAGKSRRDYRLVDVPVTTSCTTHCCPLDQKLVIHDEENRVGVCCEVGEVYRGEAPNGRCVKPDQEELQQPVVLI